MDFENLLKLEKIDFKIIFTISLGLADFTPPSAGFFLWIKVRGVQDTWKMVMQRGVTHGVLLAPGAAFMADSSKPCNAIRASFAKATYREMNLVGFTLQ